MKREDRAADAIAAVAEKAYQEWWLAHPKATTLEQLGKIFEIGAVISRSLAR